MSQRKNKRWKQGEQGEPGKSFTLFIPYLIALSSGILMGFTVAPVGAWFLAWIALAPLWVLIIKNEKLKINNDSKNSAFLIFNSQFLISLAWGIGYHGIALSWITGIHPMTWMGVPWLASLAIALFCWTFITLWGAALVATWATVMRAICCQKPKSKVINADERGYTQTKIQFICVHLHASCFKSAEPFASRLGRETLQQHRSFFRRETLLRTARWLTNALARPSAVQNPYLRVLIGTAIWCGLEALWSQGPLDWTYLAYTQSPHNPVILHLGQLTGPSAVTAALVAVNGLIAEAWINRQDAKNAKIFSAFLASWRFVNKYLAIAATLLITLHLIGFGLYTRPLAQTPQAALKVGIIQGNVPNQIKLYPEGFRRAIEGYTTGYLSLAKQGVDAVLTPEGALPFSQDEIIQSSLVAAVRQKGVVAWIGGFDTQGNHYTNSLFTFIGSGEIFSRYGKVKMVPIGEYIPFENILGGIVKRLSPLDEHQVAGSPNQVFDTPFGRAIVGICYESPFAEHFRRQAAVGGQFILSPSNDAHFSPVMPAQHHAQDTMRAIETDRWALRATNTGYSAFIDPHGRTLWISGYNTYEIHAETIYRRQTQTLYVRWGDWLTPLLLVLGALAWCRNIFWQNDDKIKFQQ